MKKNAAPELGPTELMQAMGAPSWNPIPPDQTKWQAKYKIPLFRLWSWMCDHSIRKGRRKGYVCDDHGNPLTIEDAARSLQMDPGFCRRLFREGIALGLWRRGPEGEGAPRLILSGKVSKPASIDPADQITDDEILDEDGDNDEGEEKAKPNFEKVCTDLFIPPYIRKQIKRLPAKKQSEFFTEYRGEFQGEKDMHADLTAANRLLWSPRKDKVFDKFGIGKIREVHTTKDGKPRDPRPPEREKFVQAVLPGLEEYVDGYVPLNSVQTVANGRSVQSQNGSVQTTSTGQVQTASKHTKNGATTAHSVRSGNGDGRAILEPLRVSLSASHSSTTTTIERHVQPADVVVVVHKLAVKKARAQEFVAECRRAAPGCTVEDIVACIDEKEATINKKRYPNYIPILLETVPVKLASFVKLRVHAMANEQATEPKCRACGEPLGDGLALQGCHHECYEQTHEKAKGAGR